MRVAQEFPHYDVNSIPAIPSSWEDVSWHNDACPSWLIGDIVVFVDFPDFGDRECQNTERFIITHKDTCECLFSGNDWQAVLDFVANYKA